METDERDVVTVFGFELTSTAGIGRWACNPCEGVRLVRHFDDDRERPESISIWSDDGNGVAFGFGTTTAEAESALLDNARDNIATCQRFLELFGGE